MKPKKKKFQPDHCLFNFGRLRQHYNWDGQIEEAVSERFKLLASNHLD